MNWYNNIERWQRRSLTLSNIPGLDDLDEMFPTGPRTKKGSDKKGENKVKEKDKKPAAAQKTASVKKEKDDQEPQKNEPVVELPDKKDPAEKKETTKKDMPQKEQPEKEQPEKKQPEKEQPEEKSPEERQQIEEDSFFVVPKKALFTETHSQENIWLQNDIKAELDEIFKNKPKGFKTKFYNAALRFAVKKYKNQD